MNEISLKQLLQRTLTDSQKYGLIWDVLYALDEFDDQVSMHPDNIYFKDHDVTCRDKEPVDYDPPEVLFNERQISGKDKHYYSFGIIAYDILRGHLYGDEHILMFEYSEIRASRSSLLSEDDVKGMPLGNALMILTSFDPVKREEGLKIMVNYFLKNVDCRYKLSYRYNNRVVKEETISVKTSIHELQVNDTMTGDDGHTYYLQKDISLDFRPGNQIIVIDVDVTPFSVNKNAKDLRLYSAYDDGYDFEVIRLGKEKARRFYKLPADEATTYDFYLKYKGEQRILEPVSITIPQSTTGEVTLIIDYKENESYFSVKAGNDQKQILYDDRVDISSYL